MNLDHCRRSIDDIDVQLLALLNRRADLSKQIGRLKLDLGLPIVDLAREDQIISAVRRDNPGDISDEAVVRIFRSILNESRLLQLNEAVDHHVTEASL